MGAEVGRLVTSAREEAPKQRVDRKKYPDFFFLLPCLCQCLRGQTQQKANKQGTLDDKSPTSASRQVGHKWLRRTKNGNWVCRWLKEQRITEMKDQKFIEHLGNLNYHIGSDGKSICLQCGRPRFDPWIRKIPLEKEMATHSSTHAWKIPWTEEPGGPQSMGSQRVGPTSHDFTFTPQVCIKIPLKLFV